jgi:hypothetical protein
VALAIPSGPPVASWELVDANDPLPLLTAHLAVLAAGPRASKPAPRRQVFERPGKNESQKRREFCLRWWSAARPALTASAAFSDLLRSPSFNLGTQPELDSTIAELAYRPRHVVVPVLVHAYRVAVGKTEELGYPVRVEQVVHVNLSAHASRLLQYSDPSEPGGRLQ